MYLPHHIVNSSWGSSVFPHFSRHSLIEYSFIIIPSVYRFVQTIVVFVTIVAIFVKESHAQIISSSLLIDKEIIFIDEPSTLMASDLTAVHRISGKPAFRVCRSPGHLVSSQHELNRQVRWRRGRFVDLGSNSVYTDCRTRLCPT